MYRVHACENEQCRVLLFTVGGAFVNPSCPTCWTIGRHLEGCTVVDLLHAIDKRVPPEQLTLEEMTA